MTRNMTDTVSLLWEGEEKETKLRDVKRNWNNDGGRASGKTFQGT